MNRLISIGELAELKAVSVDTIRRWEKEGFKAVAGISRFTKD